MFFLCGSVLFQMLENAMWFFRYHFTLVPVLVCLPFMMMLAVVIPLGACYGMKKRSLVERMREEE